MGIRHLFSQGMVAYGIFDQLLEGIQVIDRNMSYFYVNEAVAHQSGKRQQELLGKKMTAVFPGIEETKIYHLIQECH